MLLFIVLVLFVASLGKCLGLSDNYAKLLLRLFEFGREKIETAEEKQDEKNTNKEDKEHSKQNGYASGALISKEKKLAFDPGSVDGDLDKLLNSTAPAKKEFQLEDVLDYAKAGVEVIIEDEVTKCFAAEELPAWNLLTRTNKNYQFLSIRLTFMWGLGVFLRYFVLFPIRLFLTAFGVGWLLMCTATVGCIPEGRIKRFAYWYASISSFRIFGCAASAIVTYHNKENRAKGGGICVANHTSPIDIVVLASDNCYALVGQSHGGFLGVLQQALSRATCHIWFERSEIKDRELVAKRLREHVEDETKLPILVFPEGTCINNTSVMMFKKGSFEVGGVVYPVAIKYDQRFADPYWNSSRQSYMQYLYMMLTSWALVCDVWYLPPMSRKADESAVDFSNRVKSEIALKGGLVDLMWDGQLKRAKVKPEWIELQQKKFSSQLKVE